MRLNSDGSFDTTFDGDGKFNAANVSNDYTAAMALTDNGNRILLAGYAANNVSGIDIQDVVLVQVTDQRIGRMQSPHELTFDVDLSGHGTGQLVQGDYGVFDGLNRLEVGGFATLNNASSSQDGGRSIVLSGLPVVSLTIGREVTVPKTGSQDFTRTIDVFTNNTGGPISTTVRLMGNLGSDASTTVFATSDGDTLVEPTDWWFGTDDGDGIGTPAIIHLIHGPSGLLPSSVSVIDDNVDWTYDLTVAPGETQRLATFTILSNTRAEAISAVNALISNGGFGGEAASFLTQAELDSLANFQFNQAPTDIALSNSSLPENAGADYIIGSLLGNDPNGDALSFSVPANLGGNNLFNISGTSLRTNNSFNFEAGHSYLITVRATDSGGLTFDKQFTITITDVNESPTAVTLTPASLTLPENYSTSSAVAVSTIAVTDDALGTNNLTLSGTDAGNFEIVGNQLRLKAGVVLDFEAKSSFSVTVNVDDTAVGGAAPDAFAMFTLALTNVTELGGIDTQLGQSQRSYVRYLDVLFDRPDDILSMINTGRINLTKKDLNGLSPVSVPLTPSMFSTVGNSARLDFGVNGLGGNRNTTAGDGYYELGVDMDGNGSFESKKYFYRLLGDVNGDRKVDSADSSLVTSSFGTTNAERDVNGDGTVNSNDRTLVLRSVGRKLKDDLFADD